MSTKTKQQLITRLEALDTLDAERRAEATQMIADYVAFLLDSSGVFIAGPIAVPGGTTATYASFDCPKCSHRISATFT
jgi:hypothetical protein